MSNLIYKARHHTTENVKDNKAEQKSTKRKSSRFQE